MVPERSISMTRHDIRAAIRDLIAELGSLRPWLIVAGLGVGIGFVLAVVALPPSSFF